MSIKLVTDNLQLGQRSFRTDLVSNLKIIEIELNKFESFYSKLPDYIKDGSSNDLKGDITKQISDTVEELNARINRIVLGTDNESIELVVTQILKDKGVID